MIKRAALIILLLVIATMGVLQFPEAFVPKQLDYKNFELYSKDSIVLNDDLIKVLDSVIVNIKKSEFYQGDQVFELYFIKGTFYERVAQLFGANHLASSKFNKHLYFGDPNFAHSKLVKGLESHGWVNLVQIISHEAVHSQMYQDYSQFGFMKTQPWINEGYCEYISYDPQRNKATYNLADLYHKYKHSDDDWVATEYASLTPRLYLRDRIIMEYLMDHKGLSILDIIGDSQLNPETILTEIDGHL